MPKINSPLTEDQPQPNSPTTKTNQPHKKLFIVVNILLLISLALNAYLFFKTTRPCSTDNFCDTAQIESSVDDGSVTEPSQQETTTNPQQITTKESDEISDFQTLLISKCEDSQTNLSQLPFTFGDKYLQEFSYDDKSIGCNLKETIYNGSNTGYLMATSDTIPADFYLGDANSVYEGMRGPNFDYQQYLKEYPQTKVLQNGDITHLINVLPGEPCCNNDASLTLEVYAYRSLGNYQMILSTYYNFTPDAKVKAIFKKHGEIATEDDKCSNEGEYKICDQTKLAAFAKDFFNQYFASYDTVAKEYKTLLTEQAAVLESINLKE